MMAVAGGFFPLVAQTQKPAFPAATAQPGHSDPLWSEAARINSQRDRAFRARDLNALAALYTQDADYIELLPALLARHGQAEIKVHFQQLIDANVSNLSTVVSRLVTNADGSALVTGDYSLV